MSKKLWTTLFCIGILAITITLLLVFLLNHDDKIKLSLNKDLSSTTNDISVTVGKRVYDFYDVSDKSAELSFDLDKQGIIFITEEYIEGLQVGEVNVVMTAKTSKQTTKNQFKVKVSNNEFTFEFISIQSCTFEEENIYVSNQSFQFNIEVYDKDNHKMENVDYNIISNNTQTIIERSFSTILVVAKENCTLTFIFKDLSVTFSKNIIFH